MIKKTWVKILISVIGSGSQGGLTYAASIYPDLAMIFGYLTLAIGGTMTLLIGWPAKD